MNAESRRRRVFAVVAVAVSIATLGYLAFGSIGENLVYYWSPSELKDAGVDAVGANVRLGGLVVPGSIVHSGDSLALSFEVTDGSETVQVIANAVPPAMFRGGIGVVLEGTLLDNGTFESQRLMVKHDNEYRVPEEGDARSIKELVESMQFEETGP